jgi:hypothetical protein
MIPVPEDTMLIRLRCEERGGCRGPVSSAQVTDSIERLVRNLDRYPSLMWIAISCLSRESLCRHSLG